MQKFMWLTVGLLLACDLPAQLEPNAGHWKTWVIPSGSALRLPAPPDAEGTAAEIQWVKDCLANRSQAVLTQIHYWDAGAPGYRWMQLAQQLAVSEALPTPLQTRALSLVAAAIYDATVAAWDSKYAYMRQHPSEMDPTITTVIKPTSSPSYPSEHAVTAGPAATVLAYLFPDQASAVAEMANQAGQSRILAVHRRDPPPNGCGRSPAKRRTLTARKPANRREYQNRRLTWPKPSSGSSRAG